MATTKFRIKFGFDDLNPSQLRDYAQAVHDGMDGNGLYPNPDPDLPTFLGYIVGLSNAIDAWGTRDNHGSSADKAALDAAIPLVELAMTRLGNFAENKTPYDREAFITAGFRVTSERRVPQVLPAPENARQMHADNLLTGQAKLRCDPLDGASIYIWQGTQASSDTDPAEYDSDGATIIISGLTPGQLYHFRVMGFNTKGRGAMSDVVEVRCAY